MRIIGIDNLKGNEIIGRDVMCENGAILLKRGTKYRHTFKPKLLEYNVLELYIDDEISKGIVPEELISSAEKKFIVKGIKQQFDLCMQNLTMDVQHLYSISESLMEKIFEKNIILDIMDIQRNDDFTYEHCLNVAILATTLCYKMGLNQELSHKIIAGALIHDIGKIILPKDILTKPGKLTKEEEQTIQTHTQLGYSMIKDNVNLDAVTKVIVLCHHERQDGSGYPLKKKDDLHIGAKIVAACDVFDALMSNRPHRMAYPLNQSLMLFRQEKLDPVVKDALQKIVAFYPVGTTVLLNDGTIGIVEKNYLEDLNRPAIRVIYNARTMTREDERVFLQKSLNLEIVGKLNYIPGLDDK